MYLYGWAVKIHQLGFSSNHGTMVHFALPDSYLHVMHLFQKISDPSAGTRLHGGPPHTRFHHTKSFDFVLLSRRQHLEVFWSQKQEVIQLYAPSQLYGCKILAQCNFGHKHSCLAVAKKTHTLTKHGPSQPIEQYQPLHPNQKISNMSQKITSAKIQHLNLKAT